jgi:hypothetical protein
MEQEQHKFPVAPPHRDPVKYAEQFGTGFLDKLYLRNYGWHHSGHPTGWHSKENNKTGETVCYHNRALVRGDGKILSEIHKSEDACDSCQHFATVVNGHLKGLDDIGMYEFK